MRELLPTLKGWEASGRRFALATVIETWGSSPRPVGSVMAIRDDGLACGSVSGGCVEGAVVEQALEALRDGSPRSLTFGPVEEGSVWEVGLTCGGTVSVWIDPDPVGRDTPVWRALADCLNDDLPFVLATDLDSGERTLWQPGDPDPTAAGVFERRQSALSEDRRRFYQVFAGRERLLIVGASHIAISLVAFAKDLGFETVLIEPRTQLATEERFPTPPDRIVKAWPQEALGQIGLTSGDYAVVLSHDPKLDDGALAVLLRSPVAYIGALGSRTTQDKRRRALSAEGLSERELNRIYGPVGLDIGAKTPQEIALSIMAEIVQVRRGRG